MEEINSGTSGVAREFGDIQLNPPTYKKFKTFSTYVTMRDGVKLAVNFTLPTGPDPVPPLPTILVQTRYWRSIELNPPFDWLVDVDEINPRTRGLKRLLTGQGYALVVLDVRGTGASFGTWRYPWTPESIEDSREILDWTVEQPWCNGKIGTFGISYLGTTSEFLLTLHHKAVKAVVPMFNHPDPYRDVGLPGGILNERFIQAWSDFDHMLDKNTFPELFGFLARLLVRGVRPVDGINSRELLANATREHEGNGNTIDLARMITFRDDTNEESLSIDHISLASAKNQPLDPAPAIFSWGSWMDAGTASAAIERFERLPNPQWCVIGAWNHGGLLQSSPYLSPQSTANPPLKKQWKEMIHFFNVHLKKKNVLNEPEHRFFYFTMGEEQWKSSNAWPPDGFIDQAWYLREGNELAVDPPFNDGGMDRYRVDFSHSTGLLNRWWELGATENKSVAYQKRDNEDGRFVYTSAPLIRDVEITGYPLVNLHMSSTMPDGAVYVYLEDVNENGTATYVTEGLLRLIHRKVHSDSYRVPIHSYLREDSLQMPKGETVPVTIAMQPTSVLIRKGHRIQIALAGHDAETFIRIPEEGGTPVYTIVRSKIYPSHVVLPVQYR